MRDRAAARDGDEAAATPPLRAVPGGGETTDAPRVASPVLKAPVDAPGDGAEAAAEPMAPQKDPKDTPPPRAAKVRGGPRVIEIAPVAPPARMELRHWIGIAVFVLIVVLPTLGSAWYLWTRATDQFSSSAGFTVRREDTAGVGADLLGGVASQISGTATTADTDILHEFIQSQEMVARLDARFDLRALYAAHWERDPLFSVRPDATTEDLLSYWGRMARVTYDQSSGLIDLEVLAFEPRTAQELAQAVLEESTELINALNATARAEGIRFATADLEQALTRLKEAREALVLFRTRTQIVDPQTDLQGRLGVVNNLQGQLAAALVELDILSEQAVGNDPRIAQAQRRIDVIRNRIGEERRTVTTGAASVAGSDDYPTLLAEYEGLLVDREFAEESYRAALTALDIANTQAQRQSRYLAVYVNPTLPQASEYPRRVILVGLVAIFSMLVWAIGMLIFYSVRDSR